MNKSILLGFCLIVTPPFASSQGAGPVGGSESPGIELYSKTTGREEDLDALVRRNLSANQNRLPRAKAEEATARSAPKPLVVPLPASELQPAAPTTAEFLR